MERLRSTWGVVASRVRQRIRSWRAGASPPASGRETQGGQGLAEYALILALIAVVAIGALGFFGQELSAVFWDPINAMIRSVAAGV